MQGIGAGGRFRGEGFGEDGIDIAVHGFDACGDGRSGIGHDLRGDHLRAGDQTQGAFQCEGTDQTEGHQSPEQDIDPLGGLLQQESERHHSQDQPAGGKAHVEDL